MILSTHVKAGGRFRAADVKLRVVQNGQAVAKQKKRSFRMSSRICCPGGHATKKITVREAAIALSERRAIGACEKCGKPLQYRIDHIHANNDPAGEEYAYVATRAVRLKSRLADKESYDPFLLVLREIETGKEQVLPAFFAPGQTGGQRGGPASPLLSFEEWKTLFRRLDANFSELEERIRLRAYELYELRGRNHGCALDDWLRAEAEIRGEKALRAAA
jgi:hypothetical protein